MSNTSNFYDFMQWLSKKDKIQFNAYTLKAFVTYETDNNDFSFYDEEQTVIVTTDSQKVGTVYLPDLDTDLYFSEFCVIWQDFLFDERKKILVIKSRVRTNYKRFSTYTITIRNMKKTKQLIQNTIICDEAV